MKVLVAGSHGLVGGALLRALEDRGHQAVAVVRPGAGPGRVPVVHYDPRSRRLESAEAEALGPFHAVVNLAGAGIGDRRWSEGRRHEILESRVAATATLVGSLELLGAPKVVVNASAVGAYGDRGEEVLTETSGFGSGFLAEVVRAWESAAAPAAEHGRLVLARSAMVLAAAGGALARQLPLFRLGLGGSLGGGRQWLSWITLHDEVAALLFALEHDVLHGPVNLASPQPVRNAEFTAALARALRRPAFLGVPAFALKAALGAQLADELLLVSQRVVPAALEDAGFRFAHPGIDQAMAAVLGGGSGEPGPGAGRD